MDLFSFFFIPNRASWSKQLTNIYTKDIICASFLYLIQS
jgi:hypothetical protein